MIKMSLNGPSKRDLAKLVNAAVEKQITTAVQKVARAHGGVKIRFKHKADGTVASVEFEGAEKAVVAARAAIAD
ncbi:hypothetical protein GCM10027046_23130 [Uliginosibacterium flavum]|uniref:Uncharacterized protein n=1 Tax=Uliginosibacterium flavum TaxID=1396831 RepID=A0ABV2TMJ5_9RHOO